MRELAAALLAAALASPGAAATLPLSADIAVSSAPFSQPAPINYRFDYQKQAGPEGTSSVGVGVGLSEGKPLEMMVWGSGGAIIGGMAGPLGAIVGGSAGTVVGLLVSIFIVPHNGPEPD